MPRTIEVSELILRDGHQSLMATRRSLEDMLPACEDIDNAGFWSVEYAGIAAGEADREKWRARRPGACDAASGGHSEGLQRAEGEGISN